jgi:hypothetical protein
MRRALTGLGALGLALLAATPVAAQGKATEYLQVLTVTVKPGAVADYEDYVKKVLAAMNKAPGSPPVVYTMQALSGPSYTYVISFPFNKWGDTENWLNTGQILAKAYGEAEAAKMMKAGRSAIERSDTTVYRLSNSSSSTAVPNPLPKYAHMVRTEIAAGGAREYEAYLGKVKDAEIKQSAPGRIRRTSVQGQSGVYLSIRLHQTQAERDGWPGPGEIMTKAYGEAEANRTLDAANRVVQKREILLLLTRPDLSRMPAGS